jgi:hypothetical protein
MLTPSSHDHLGDVLIRPQVDRDAISSLLMRYRDQDGQDQANIVIDFPDDVSGGAATGRPGAPRA